MNTYRVYANIDLDAFESNIRALSANISDQTMLMGVIKANGYGHGAVELAKCLENNKAEWIGVAAIDEAIELRKSKISLPILVFGYIHPDQYDDLITYKVTPTIFTLQMAAELEKAAAVKGSVLDVHVKIDTGMSRIGFPARESTMSAIETIQALPHLRIQGIYTHFACADMKDRQTTQKQLNHFHQVLAWLDERSIDIPVKHCSNSAGIFEYPEANMDMVRAGISIYGLYPSEEVHKEKIKLTPVMSLKSRIIQIKILDAGYGIGYGHTYITKHKTTVATIPVGYGDGYPRKLSNQGRVLIKGQSAPIIGRVCMDQMMVDITGLNNVFEGDEVTLIGRDQDECISVEELANMVGSFNYEFVCDVGRRIPRVYLREGKPVRSVNYLFQVN